MSEMDEKKLADIRRKKLGKKDVKMRRRNRVERIGNGEKKMEDETPLITGIKEMPAYDPDMELKGLNLTIPTWIGVIARAETKMNVELATARAKEQLTANLMRLREQVSHTLEVLK